jgi:DNA-binding CsgD family transcriptional regulator
MHITKRQLEVLELVQKGFSNKVIAKTLKIAESTVKIYIRELLRIYGATNRSQLAVYSIQGQEVVLSELEQKPMCWIKKVGTKIRGVVFSNKENITGWLPMYLKENKEEETTINKERNE